VKLTIARLLLLLLAAIPGCSLSHNPDLPSVVVGDGDVTGDGDGGDGDGDGDGDVDVGTGGVAQISIGNGEAGGAEQFEGSGGADGEKGGAAPVMGGAPPGNDANGGAAGSVFEENGL
jgi:hypothetical protein